MKKQKKTKSKGTVFIGDNDPYISFGLTYVEKIKGENIIDNLRSV